MSGKRPQPPRGARIVALGVAGLAATTGCSVPSSLAASLDKLPDVPEPSLPNLPLANLVGLGPAETPTDPLSPTVPPSLEAQSSSGATAPASPAVADGTALVVGKTDGDGVYIRSSIKPEKKVKVWQDRHADGRRRRGSDRSTVEPGRTSKDPAGNVGWVPARYLTAA